MIGAFPTGAGLIGGSGLGDIGATENGSVLLPIFFGGTFAADAVGAGSQTSALYLLASGVATSTAEGSATYPLALGQSGIGAGLVDAAHTAAIIVSYLIAGGIDAEGTFSSHIKLTSTATADATAEAYATYPTTYSGNAAGDASVPGAYDASITMGTSLATQIIAEAIAEAGIAFGHLSNVTFSGTQVTAELITPDGRTMTVTASARGLIIGASPRTHTVN